MTALVLTVLYTATAIRKFHDNQIPSFSLSMTIGSVILRSWTSLGIMEGFSVISIPSVFNRWDVWAAARQAWVFIYWSGGDREVRCDFLNGYVRRYQFESFPCFNKTVIHMCQCEFLGGMITHLVHYLISIHFAELQVWPIIFEMIMYTVTCI